MRTSGKVLILNSCLLKITDYFVDVWKVVLRWLGREMRDIGHCESRHYVKSFRSKIRKFGLRNGARDSATQVSGSTQRFRATCLLFLVPTRHT